MHTLNAASAHLLLVDSRAPQSPTRSHWPAHEESLAACDCSPHMSLDDSSYLYHAYAEAPHPAAAAVPQRRWSIMQCLFCWRCTGAGLPRDIRNTLLWNLTLQGAGIIAVFATIIFEGELNVSDMATLANVAIAVPLLSFIATALQRHNPEALRSLNRWVILVVVGYAAATALDLIVAGRWGAACLNDHYDHPSADEPPPPHAPPPPPHEPMHAHPRHGSNSSLFIFPQRAARQRVWLWHETTCWHGHRRAVLLAQLVVDAASLYTFACQLHYNILLLRDWRARPRFHVPPNRAALVLAHSAPAAACA